MSSRVSPGSGVRHLHRVGRPRALLGDPRRRPAERVVEPPRPVVVRQHPERRDAGRHRARDARTAQAGPPVVGTDAEVPQRVAVVRRERDEPVVVLDDLDRHLGVGEHQHPSRKDVVVGIGQVAEDMGEPGAARDPLEVAQRHRVVVRGGAPLHVVHDPLVPSPSRTPAGAEPTSVGVGALTGVPKIEVEEPADGCCSKGGPDRIHVTGVHRDASTSAVRHGCITGRAGGSRWVHRGRPPRGRPR